MLKIDEKPFHAKILGSCENGGLQYAFIRLTSRCSGRCSFCDVWRDPKDAHPNLDWNSIASDLRDLAPLETNLHGGEAHLSRFFTPFLAAVKGEFPLSITTKGDAIFAPSFPLLLNAGLQRVFFSIDRVDPGENARSRGVPSLETMLFPAITNLHKERPDIRLIANHVVTKSNAHEISAFIKKMVEIGISHVALIPVKDAPDEYLTQDSILRFQSEIDKLLLTNVVSRSFFLNGLTNPFGSSEHEFESASRGVYNSCRRSHCSIPSGVLFIDAVTGNVYPCDTTMYRENAGLYVMGNLCSTTLKEIWQGERFDAFGANMMSNSPAPCRFGCDPCNEFI